MSPKNGARCKKADNPCKICLNSVNQKTGLQCSGACRSWVHYECVNYTPGKIRDIKDGIIRVTCPCPDCETRLPKEYRVDKPTCANQYCPANFAPHCEQVTCPTEPKGGFHDNMNQTMWPSAECGAECKKHMNDPDDPYPKPWPVVKCGAECKKHSCEAETPPRSAGKQIQKSSGRGRQDNFRNDVRGDCREAEGTPSFSVVGQMCSTIGLLAKQMNELMSKMQEIAKMSTAGKTTENPGGCHDPVPCQKEPKKGNKCFCSGTPR